MSQTQKLQELLSDNLPHSTIEIMEYVYGSNHLGLARIGARVYDLIHKDSFKIVGWHDDENPTVYWYAHIPPLWNEWFEEALKNGNSPKNAYWNAVERSKERVKIQMGLFTN
jgi:hypothetical protein